MSRISFILSSPVASPVCIRVVQFYVSTEPLAMVVTYDVTQKWSLFVRMPREFLSFVLANIPAVRLLLLFIDCMYEQGVRRNALAQLNVELAGKKLPTPIAVD